MIFHPLVIKSENTENTCDGGRFVKHHSPSSTTSLWRLSFQILTLHGFIRLSPSTSRLVLKLKDRIIDPLKT